MFIFMAMLEGADDQRKFERIYHQYRFLMLHVAGKILSDHRDAEDAVQQAFVSIIENLEKIIDVDSPKTRSYIVIITERKAIDLLRQNRRRSTLELNEATAGLEISFYGEDPVAAAIAKLPARYREILLLRYDNGFTAKELAQVLGITQSGVRKLIARAKEALRQELEKEGVEL